MRIILAFMAALALAGCAAAPSTLPVIEPGEVKLDPDATYVVVTLENTSSILGAYTLCELDGSGSYKLNPVA